MAKLSKAQLRNHRSAEALLAKEKLTLDDQWAIYQHWLRHKGVGQAQML